MQKIMFNDRYDLTRLVLLRKKDVTRRMVSLDLEIKVGHDQFQKVEAEKIQNIGGKWMFSYGGKFYELLPENRPMYHVGEVVAIAQSYMHLAVDEGYESLKSKKDEKAYVNKMFVKPELMPHQIQITHIRVQRLHDMTDEDCMREGVLMEDGMYYFPNSSTAKVKNGKHLFNSPRQAFACLFDKLNKKGAWERNPWVWAYSFKLIK